MEDALRGAAGAAGLGWGEGGREGRPPGGRAALFAPSSIPRRPSLPPLLPVSNPSCYPFQTLALPASIAYPPACCAQQVEVESSGDASTDAAAVEEKLLSVRKGQAKLKVVADRGLQVRC